MAKTIDEIMFEIGLAYATYKLADVTSVGSRQMSIPLN